MQTWLRHNMNLKLLLIACLAVAVTGCTSLSKVVKELAKDDATLSLQVRTIYGSVDLKRANPHTNHSAKVTSDGSLSVEHILAPEPVPDAVIRRLLPPTPSHVAPPQQRSSIAPQDGRAGFEFLPQQDGMLYVRGTAIPVGATAARSRARTNTLPATITRPMTPEEAIAAAMILNPPLPPASANSAP